MTFQREDLVMLGVGIDNFRQPSPTLPKLVDGIHLRWSFPRKRGFPWFGYYLFRREQFQAKPRCYQEFRPKKTGSLGRHSLRLPGKGELDFGRLTSDRSLVLDSEGSIDLRDREGIGLSLPKAHPAHWVRVDLRLLGRTRIEIRFRLRDRTLGRRRTIAKLQPRSVRIEFAADAIDQIEISGGNALVREVCFTSVRDSALDRPENRWQAVPKFRYPLMLPVRGPDYFSSGPEDSAQALRLGLDRLQIGDSAAWNDESFVELHELLRALVVTPPDRRAMHEHRLDELASEAADERRPPRLGGTSPLDLVLLSTLEPAIAQMVGVYQVDQDAEKGERYDYCLIADRSNRCRENVFRARVFLSTLEAFDGDDMDFTFIAGRGVTDSKRPSPPAGLEVYALPPAADAKRGRVFQTGLRWRVAELEAPPPQTAVFYHLWRAKAGEDGEADEGDVKIKPPTEQYQPVTADRPILAGTTESETERIEVPAGWPPHRLLAHDRVAEEGWYSYRATAVDLFGRHSAFSPASAWHQWQPRPRPRPWYFSRPAVDGPVEGFTAAAFAVRLLDKHPPPRPTAVTAELLDPDDPLWVRDAASERWLEEQDNSDAETRTVRVRWSWSQTLAAQAPDAREFRVYVRPGVFNTFFARVRTVEPDGDGFSQVTLDIEGSFPPSLWSHSELSAGGRHYRVADGRAVPGADPGLRLRVAHRGPRGDITPQPGMDAGLRLPIRLAPGPVRVRQGAAVVQPEGEGWDPGLAGLAFRLTVEPEALYSIREINRSGTKMVLNRTFREPSGNGLEAQLHHVHAVDPEGVNGWAERLAVVDIDNAVATSLETGRDPRGDELGSGNARATGNRVRLDPSADLSGVRPGIDSLELQRGIRKDGPWLILAVEPPNVVRVAGRSSLTHANWRIGLAVRHYELLAALPFRLETRADRPKAYLQVGVTAADGRGHCADRFRRADPPRPGNESRVAGPRLAFAVHRQPPPPLEPPTFGHERLYTTVADVQGRSRFRLPLATPPAGYDLWIHRALDESLFEVARDLDLRLSEHDRSRFPAEWFQLDPAVGAARARAVAAELTAAHGRPERLRQLSDSALWVLAGLPGSEAAYQQLNVEPMAGRDADAGYEDALDGKAANRNFYRTALVDAAGNSGPLGGATPPVYLPRLFAPLPPVVTSIRGVDRGVLLRVAPSADPEIIRVRVFRTAERTEDPRARPNEPDAMIPVQPLVTHRHPEHEVVIDLGWIAADGIETELIALYAAESFRFDAEPLDDQPIAPLVTDLASPVEDRLHRVDLPEGLPVVLLYRDARGTLQSTSVADVPLLYLDSPLPAPRTWRYRLVAERRTGSAEGEVSVLSLPSPPWSARAIAGTPPPPPRLTSAVWVLWDGEAERTFDPDDTRAGFKPAVDLAWESAFPFEAFQLQRAPAKSEAWRAASPLLPAETHRFVDANAVVERGWRYRLRGTDAMGATNLEFHELAVASPLEEEP